eukprot:XP_011677906.1 PREDICTED: sushi, von Willebrand factor type A, EGF and pentraxin domain-containing protein 1 [Strongylocentrotus purpuratus]
MGSGLSGYTPGGTGCYDDGTLVTYICTGSLLGPPTSQCSAGIWFPPVGPTCEAASGCFRPQLPPNGNVTEYKDEYALYDRITFYCDDGYSIIGPQEVVCDSGGIWDPSNIPTCEASCTAPSIQNGGPNGTYVNGEVITYTCDVNYTLIGVSSATCRDELWDPTNVPECLEQCLPPIVANSNFDTQQDLFDHGSSVIIDCDPGYSTGSSTSTTVNCNDGSLSMESPRCYENCSPLDTFLNGQVTGDTSPFYHTETVSFSCDTGFTLDGATSITCSDGAWDAPQPMCMDQCPVIVPEAYSAFYGSAPPFQHGDMVTFTCYSGYEIYNGSITSTCQNGQWSSDPPFCTEQTTTTQAASTITDSITTKIPSNSMTTLQDTATPSTSQSSNTSPEAASTDVLRTSLVTITELVTEIKTSILGVSTDKLSSTKMPEVTSPSTSQTSQTSPKAASTDAIQTSSVTITDVVTEIKTSILGVSTDKLPSTSMTTVQDTTSPSTSQTSQTSPEAASTDVPQTSSVTITDVVTEIKTSVLGVSTEKSPSTEMPELTVTSVMTSSESMTSEMVSSKIMTSDPTSPTTATKVTTGSTPGRTETAHTDATTHGTTSMSSAEGSTTAQVIVTSQKTATESGSTTLVGGEMTSSPEKNVSMSTPAGSSSEGISEDQKVVVIVSATALGVVTILAIIIGLISCHHTRQGTTDKNIYATNGGTTKNEHAYDNNGVVLVNTHL